MSARRWQPPRVPVRVECRGIPRWPDHTVARADPALIIRRLRIALRDPVVPHPPATLRTTRLVDRPRDRAAERTSLSIGALTRDDRSRVCLGRIFQRSRIFSVAVDLDPVLLVCIQLVRDAEPNGRALERIGRGLFVVAPVPTSSRMTPRTWRRALNEQVGSSASSETASASTPTSGPIRPERRCRVAHERYLLRCTRRSARRNFPSRATARPSCRHAITPSGEALQDVPRGRSAQQLLHVVRSCSHPRVVCRSV